VIEGCDDEAQEEEIVEVESADEGVRILRESAGQRILAE
jgi:hypothetical protein